MIGSPGSGLVTLLEETTFCISDASGDIVPGGAQGLFFRDTRFISRLELRLDGELPEPVAVQPNDPFRCTFLARRPPGPNKADSTLLLIRRRYVGNGLRDEITLRNLGHEPVAAHLTVAVDSDFADLFEVKEGRDRYHDDDVDISAADGVLQLRCRRASNVGVVAITGTADPSAAPGLLTWQTVIEPGASWVASMQVTPSLDGTDVVPHYGDETDDQHGQKWERTVAMAPATLPVVGIPARTALLRDATGGWRYQGAQAPVVYVGGTRADGLSALAG